MEICDELLDLTLCPIMLLSLRALKHYLVHNPTLHIYNHVPNGIGWLWTCTSHELWGGHSLLRGNYVLGPRTWAHLLQVSICTLIDCEPSQGCKWIVLHSLLLPLIKVVIQVYHVPNKVWIYKNLDYEQCITLISSTFSTIDPNNNFLQDPLRITRN